ncbi:Acetoin utilization deacetylase AcuC [Sulfurivirga caldicuralii]|uniref:Acetoin utilization deacetylase AcuC n=1 Tax=Sulfurivirga caldicuralii TaxID=364032 RepID=A0A1N6F4H2_9GAMM|nr:histone deacetylase family protein [Sulfurivirga caldicuralii]SIN90182.1 Acetoin utilization deacetylase AcuC [Sulfurivirga caldicuralii]
MNSQPELSIWHHPACLLHDPGPLHPENRHRLEAFLARLDTPAAPPHVRFEPPVAETEWLTRVHPKAYLKALWAHIPEQGHAPLDPDTVLSSHSREAILHAAGAACAAVEWSLARPQRRAFCAIRPPGHHANRSRPAGFCFVNNVAVAAYHALAQPGIERVAIVDFDVHHGDGTEAIVAGDERILFCSSFRHPFYPGTGIPPLADNCHPIPLPAGCNGHHFREAVQASDWAESLRAFAPQLLLLSAGFDAHARDPLGGLALEAEDFAWITRWALALTTDSTQGRVVSCLEGGYDPEGVADSALAHCQALLG